MQPLPKSRSELENLFQRGTKFKYLFFWGHTQKSENSIDASCLSQWYPCSFTEDNIVYATAEHYMMAKKAELFGDDAQKEAILASSHPNEAKKLGRGVRNFDQTIWESHCLDIVTQANVAKFSQNLPLKQFLLQTEGRILVEASPVDKIWGIGLAKDDKRVQNPLQWKGENLLGFALMQAREAIKSI